MTYEETLSYLYTSAPLFQNIGAGAYKEGLFTTRMLDEHFGHPHRSYRTIHVGGTNGKGSCAHTLAAILQEAGYKVGLYTSPHLVDFRERIRVNGVPVPPSFVVRFVEEERAFFEPLHPSFFELTTAMAFRYFQKESVDVAVVEVGLGGRLDCTNIITPVLSLITNISFDHTQFLGHTLAEIAGEKAGIIKENVPVVIGEAVAETRPVFAQTAEERHAPIIFAQDSPEVLHTGVTQDGRMDYETRHFGRLKGELTGDCQVRNANSILTAVQLLQKEFSLTHDAIARGFLSVNRITGLRGRWEQLHSRPTVVCDTGHNVGGWQYLSQRLQQTPCRQLRIVFGMVNDKDISGVLALLPPKAVYYFTRASVARALDEHSLAEQASCCHLHGSCYPTVAAAYEQALHDAAPDDFIFVGGSNFVVADLLSHLSPSASD